MRTSSVCSSFVVAFVVLALVTPSQAFAYLDASSGSMILQLMLGGVAGLVVALRMYGRRFLSFFGRGSSVNPNSANSNSDSNKPE